jgi:hypothetical protein
MGKLIGLIAILVFVGIVLKVYYQSSIQPIEAPAIASQRKPLAPVTGPLRVLSSNSRYFTDGSRKAIYLTGSHVWQNLIDIGPTDPPPVFDYNAYLNFLQARGHNFMRMWAWLAVKYLRGSEQITTWAAPSPWPRPPGTAAADGKPMFDLNQLNQIYFDRLRERVIAARNSGIYVSIMLFGGQGTWAWFPFNIGNNINGINGDPNGRNKGSEMYTLPGPGGVHNIQIAYVRKVIDTINDLDNVLYEIANEFGVDSKDWQYEMINYIKNYERGKPKQHPVGMTALYGGSVEGSGTNAELFNSPADWISPLDLTGLPGWTGGHWEEDMPPAIGSKVIVLDSDHLTNALRSTDPAVIRKWVWESFTRGLNPIYMDGGIETFPASNDYRNAARDAMGDTRTYATKMNLAVMVPRNDLCSSTYCLANPGKEYLVYLPPRRRHSIPFVGGFFKSVVTVDLSEASGTLSQEWFNPRTGQTVATGTTTGGKNQTFTPPFGGDAVLYLKSR